MRDWIGGKVSLVLGVLLAGAIAIIKYLRLVNAKKELENAILKENAATKEAIHADEIKRTKFNAEQKVKADLVNDDSNIVSLAKKRGEVKDEDNFTAVDK